MTARLRRELRSALAAAERAAGKRLAARDLPSALYQRLLAAFGTLAEARRELSARLPERPRRWTRASVIAELRAYRGEPVTWKVLEESNPPLAGAVRAVFGSLEAARRAARVRGPEPRRGKLPPKWDADLVIAEIRLRHRRGEPLATRDVRHLAGGLWRAAHRHCGSWREAIEAAGLDYDEIRRLRAYDADGLISEVQTLAARRPTLSQKAFRNHRVGRAALRRFRSIERVRAEIGRDDWPVERKRALPSKAELRARLRRRVHDGRSVTVSAIREEEQELVTAALRYFGTWSAALRTLRIPHDERINWTRRLVLKRLRERLARGTAVTDHALHADDPRLYGAAQRLFGSRAAAVSVANRHR